MRSIRARLLVALIILVAFISLVAAAVTYRRVLNETSTLFDYQLRQMALSLRSQISLAPRIEVPPDQGDTDFVIQIWDVFGARTYLSRPGLPMTATIGNAAARTSADAGNAASAPARLGLALRPLSPEERRQAGVSGGLVVEDAEGRAAEAGIQQGDVVLSVDGTPVQSVSQMRKMVQEHDKQIALLIQRGDARLFVPVTLG